MTCQDARVPRPLLLPVALTASLLLAGCVGATADDPDPLVTASQPASPTATQMPGQVESSASAPTASTPSTPAAPAKPAVWSFNCGGTPLATLQEVWTSSANYCSTVDPAGEWTPSAQEQAVIDTVVNGQGASGTDAQVFDNVLGKCIKMETTLSDERPWWYEAALQVCPDAPHAPDMALLTEKKILTGDGSRRIGAEGFAAGTYRSDPEARECYWERSTGTGDTIANDFVTYAADGVTVTLKDGESFTAERCGMWRWIG